MFLDMIHGTIDRRVLLNYRFDPDALQKTLPKPFRPKLYQGHGIGGVCMIRFAHLRPQYVPTFLGVNSENAAHRITVEWEQDNETKEGVFIPRRDTNSFFNKNLGGKIFPGIFNRSQFIVSETSKSIAIKIIRPDGKPQIDFMGKIVDQISPTSIFPSLDEATKFFALGATGYSATKAEGYYHGMELRTLKWSIEPMAIDHATSDFYDNRDIFPMGSVKLDSALVMRNIPHEWHSRPDLYATNDRRSLSGKK